MRGGPCQQDKGESEGVLLVKSGITQAPIQIMSVMDCNPMSKNQTIYWLLNALWGLTENRIFTCSESALCKLLTNYERKTVTLQQRSRLSKSTLSRRDRLNVPPEVALWEEHTPSQAVLQPKRPGLNLMGEHWVNPKWGVF